MGKSEFCLKDRDFSFTSSTWMRHSGLSVLTRQACHLRSGNLFHKSSHDASAPRKQQLSGHNSGHH